MQTRNNTGTAGNLSGWTLRAFALVGGMGLTLVGGCGGDDDGQAGSSGVSGSKSLLELTREEAIQLCKFSEKLYKDSLGTEEQYCTAEALDGADSADSCEEYK